MASVVLPILINNIMHTTGFTVVIVVFSLIVSTWIFLTINAWKRNSDDWKGNLIIGGIVGILLSLPIGGLVTTKVTTQTENHYVIKNENEALILNGNKVIPVTSIPFYREVTNGYNNLVVTRWENFWGEVTESKFCAK